MPHNPYNDLVRKVRPALAGLQMEPSSIRAALGDHSFEDFVIDILGAGGGPISGDPCDCGGTVRARSTRKSKGILTEYLDCKSCGQSFGTRVTKIVVQNNKSENDPTIGELMGLSNGPVGTPQQTQGSKP